MTKTRNKVLALALAACLSAGALGAYGGITARGALSANALDATSTVTYPFETGVNAFRYAPSFTGVTETGGDHWEFIQIYFDDATVDFTDVKYVAVEVRVDQGSPRFTVGLHQSGNRFMTGSTDKKCYFIDENGTISELTVAGGSDIGFTQGARGTLLVPMESLVWQWATGDLSKVDSFYLTHNTNYFANWKITIGNIGIYKGEPDTASVTTIADCASQERAKSKYYVDSSNVDCMKMPSDSEKVEQTPPVLPDYPFRTGDEATLYAGDWSGPAEQSASDNWQTLKIKFDEETVDFSSATYLAIHYNVKKSAPGITFGLQNKDARYSVGADSVNDEPVFFANEGSTASAKVANITYGAVTAGSITGQKGVMIIPMTSMAWQFGSAQNKTLSAVDTLILTTNSKYNYDFEIVVGEVGYYTGTAENMGTFHKVLTLNEETEKFTATSDDESDRGTVTVITPETPSREMMGDVTIDVKGEGKSASYFTVWDGGAHGVVEMTEDTYGDAAMKLMATTANEGGDAYTAITLSNTGGFSWAGMKGVSFWARNDSDKEISFNVEVNCRAEDKSDEQESDRNNNGTRFNIQHGNRFYLYDVNTGKTSIYMTRSLASIPVGFEGWVWIPFTAFDRANWPSGNGTMTKNKFMQEGTYVSYLAITIHQATYSNKAFSVNKFGAYSTTPHFESVYVNANGLTVPQLLGLNTKEGN